MEIWIVNGEDIGIELTGKYTRMIRIYLICLLAVILTYAIEMIIKHHWQEWYLFVPALILMLIWLPLYSKPIKVEVRSGRLYLRNKEIDVTWRIHQVKRQNENMITIRFNFLYQLNIMGDQEQIDQVEEQLKHYK